MFSVIVAWLQLGERPTRWEATGIVLILAALGVLSWAGWRELVEDGRPAAEGAQGQSSSDDLSHDGDVGQHSVAILRPSPGHAKSRHDLVK